MKAQGVPWISPHVMRHSFASICASNGIDIYRIATWLRDDIRVVQRHYAKLRPDDRELMLNVNNEWQTLLAGLVLNDHPQAK
jgi:integrase